MSSKTARVDQLFSQAAAQGTVPHDSLQALHDLGAEIEQAMGVSADDVNASEVMLLTQLIDDSGSIRFSGNSDEVREGHNKVLQETGKSSSEDDVLAHTTYLNDGTLFPYVPLKQATSLDQKNYNPTGGTPLYDLVMVTLGAVLAKEQEFANQGVPVRTVTLIVTDGADTCSRHGPEEAARLVRSMLARENHIVAFMGIDDGSTDFRAVARSMGVRDEWILTPQNDGHSLRQCFGLVSKASRSAAQGMQSFSATARQGFDSGII